MKRVTKKDTDGHYYMTGDGIFSCWSAPEKFKGEDVDTIGAIEDILGDDYDLDRLRELVQADKSGRCTIISTPERIMVYEGLEHDIEPDRLRELVEADRNRRCVVLPKVDEKSKKSFIDGLEDVFNEWKYEDKSVGIFGMSDGEKALSAALMSALKGESK